MLSYLESKIKYCMVLQIKRENKEIKGRNRAKTEELLKVWMKICTGQKGRRKETLE